jgi:hypothetical protein
MEWYMRKITWEKTYDASLVRGSTRFFFDYGCDYSKNTKYEEMDEGIRETVKVLNDNGVVTLYSCDGHGENAPYIICTLSKTPLEIAQILHEAEAYGFTINDSWVFTAKDFCSRNITIKFDTFWDGVVKK